MNLHFLFLRIFYFVAISCIAFDVYANNSYTIYLDADFTGTKASSISIQQGIQTALSEVNNEVQGIRLNVVSKNHRGNTL